MIQYYQLRAGKYIPASSQMPKTCKTMAAKYNWLKQNLIKCENLNREFLENDNLIIQTLRVGNQCRIYQIKIYQHNPATLYSSILEIWDNREAIPNSINTIY